MCLKKIPGATLTASLERVLLRTAPWPRQWGSTRGAPGEPWCASATALEGRLRPITAKKKAVRLKTWLRQRSKEDSDLDCQSPT